MLKPSAVKEKVRAALRNILETNSLAKSAIRPYKNC
jgi:hypothetical protein